jgi:hypothetical protein
MTTEKTCMTCTHARNWRGFVRCSIRRKCEFIKNGGQGPLVVLPSFTCEKYKVRNEILTTKQNGIIK